MEGQKGPYVHSERAKGGGEARLPGRQNCFGLETLRVGGTRCSGGKRSGLPPPLRRPTARAGARAHVAATLARVCRAAEQERERAKFFWQRLGRCATWREGSPVTLSAPPLLLRGRVLQVPVPPPPPGHLGLPKFDPEFPSLPSLLSLSLKQNETQVVDCGLQNIYFFAERASHSNILRAPATSVGARAQCFPQRQS